MTTIDALLELLGRVGACRDAAVLINDEELLQWPGAAVKAMKSQKLIVKARPASSVICSGCERNCVMPVYTLSAATGKHSSFIVCDKRSDVNRVSVPIERLIQWQCNVEMVSNFIATNLSLRHPARQADSDGLWEIGIVSGNKRSQMIWLEASGTLNLIVGSSKVPFAEFIEFHDDAYVLDTIQIRRLADLSTTADERYTPSNTRREARKLKTQEMYKTWQKAYQKMKRETPGMSDVWYSQRIAKMNIAQGSSEETIRKKMK